MSSSKKAVATGTLAAVLALANVAPARADEGKERFYAPVPCTVSCPYWVELACIGCNPDGLVRQTSRPLGYDEPVIRTRLVTDTCDAPGPPGSYEERHLGVPPEGAERLGASVFYLIDWDIAICAKRPPTEEEVRADPADLAVRWRLEDFGEPGGWASSAGGDDCSVPPPPPFSCYPVDTASTDVTPSAEYKIIAYNWSDYPEAHGQWSWR